MQRQFMFGAVYIIEQDYTDDEIYQDLKNMRDCGFTLVTLWPVQNAWIAKSSHEWIFAKTRYVLDCCQKLGMKAILQLFGQNQAQEFMPDSALIEEMEYTDQYGPWYNVNCFWANLNHPTVREYIDLYFREAITALKDHPAVYGWDVFNEAHFRSDDSWTIEKYREYLKETYKSIEKLNKEWYRRYESFSQIRPEMRRAPYSIWSSLLPGIEYEKFRSVNLTEICRFLYETAKKYDENHPIIIDGTSSAVLAADITMRNNDEFETAYVPDIYGATFYPKSWGRNYKAAPWTLSMYFSIPAAAAKLAGKPYFVNELQTHTQSVLTPGSEVSCEELTAWTLMCIFTGIAGMQLWRWRPFLHGYQATGRGLTQMNGTPNERAYAMKEMLDVVHRNETFFTEGQAVKPSVGILYSYDIRLFFDSLLKYGEAGKSFWAENLEGWYKLFWKWAMPVDFINLSRWEKIAEKPPVMILPGAVRISNSEALQLQNYVKNGGILIADGRMGALNENACVPPEGIPGSLLSELFGIMEIDVGCEQSMIAGEKKLPVGYQYQKLKLVDTRAKVLASMEDGTPAVVSHSYGQGRTLYFNNFEGLILLQKTWPELEAIIWDMVGQKAKLYVREKQEQVHISYLESDDSVSILAVNFSNQEQKVFVHGVPEGIIVKELFSDAGLVSGETLELALPADSHSVFMYKK